LTDAAGRQPPIIYYRHEQQRGHPAAMNIGVELAAGEWIKPLDDDDYLAPNCVERMSRLIENASGAVLCSCRAMRVDVREKEIGPTTRTGPEQAFCVAQSDIHYGMLLELLPLGTTSQVAFRKGAFLRAGGWNPDYVACQDVDSWVRIARFGDAIFSNEVLAYRTMWRGSHYRSISVAERLDANMKVKESIYDLVSARHQSMIPSLSAIRKYLKLHWSVVSLREGRPWSAIRLAGSAALSPNAWRLLAQAMRFRSEQWPTRGLGRRPIVI
jgi:hypothetical protein